MVKAFLANSLWWLGSGPACAAFVSALDDPAAAQEKILRRYLHDNANTVFGREHGFAEIRTPAQFAQRVPVRDYDEFHPWIDRIREGETRVLTTDPVTRLVATSGSTAARKLIPYNASLHRELNRAIGPWIFNLYRHKPRALMGPSYWSISPASTSNIDEQDSAVPIGFDQDSAYLGNWRKRLIDAAMAVPSEVKNIPSIEEWRYTTALLLLRQRALSLISVWHPSFLTLLLDTMRKNWNRLLDDIKSGTCAVVTTSPAPERADELRGIDPVSAGRFWPRLEIISCWADSHAAAAAMELSQAIPGIEIQPKGLLATEGVVSIPFEGLHPLAICSHFFEFEDDAGRILLASELQQGRTYTVILTTAGGLYRYRLGDQIQVVGTAGRTPFIHFIGKAGLVSDQRGEKLSDGFAITVLANLFETNPRPSFAMLAPDSDGGRLAYTLYLNTDISPAASEKLDDLLCANPQYAYCRRLEQLHPPRLYKISGDAYAAYCGRLQKNGQRLGDIKPAGLSCLDHWSRHFSGNYLQDFRQAIPIDGETSVMRAKP